MALHVNGGADPCTWLIDNGCTSHMMKDMHLFSDIDKSTRTRVILGHEETIFVEGKAIVVMHIKRRPMHISNILYVPRLSQNLLNIS